jgi:ribonuclease HI
MHETNQVVIYTDGSASPNPGGGGYAALLIYGDAQKEISGSKPHTTNNEMELTAAVKALETLSRPCEVELHTDSSYMRNGITKWIHGWLKNGWKTSKGTPVENQALWVALYEQTQRHKINWQWVKGHSTNTFNQRVDVLANEARKKKLNPLP